MAVTGLLIEHGLHDLGLHSGLFSDSMVPLIEAGVLTNRKKTLNPGKAVTTTVEGTRALFDYVNHNSLIAGFPCDYTHDTGVIASNYKMTCINSALRIDLTGQVCSETIGTRRVSGTGGQLNYIRGANMAPDGKGIICLYSSFSNKDGIISSNIMPTLEPGDAVSVPATDVAYVVTEYGIVNLRGKNSWQRVKSLISIAHPDCRAELEEQAERMHLISPATKDL